MKKVRYLVIVLMAVLILISIYGAEKVSAMNTGFETEELSEEEITQLLSHFDISVLTIEPQKRGISCFDVNENGYIVIGLETSNEEFVCVYDENGDFIHGYKIQQQYGGSFGVGWDGDNVIIYFVRGDMAVSLDADGVVQEVLEIKNTSKNNDYWNNTVYLTKRKVGDKEYILRNDRGIFSVLAFSYSQLVVKDADGNETIIYDSGNEDFLRFIGIAIFAIGVVAIFLFGLIQKDKERRKKMESVT